MKYPRIAFALSVLFILGWYASIISIVEIYSPPKYSPDEYAELDFVYASYIIRDYRSGENGDEYYSYNVYMIATHNNVTLGCNLWGDLHKSDYEVPDDKQQFDHWLSTTHALGSKKHLYYVFPVKDCLEEIPRGDIKDGWLLAVLIVGLCLPILFFGIWSLILAKCYPRSAVPSATADNPIQLTSVGLQS
jgi:hypothetical protein